MPSRPSTDRAVRRLGASLLMTAPLGACGGGQASPVESAAAPAPASDQAPAAPDAAAATAPSEEAAPKLSPITKTPYGQVDGKDVELYTLTNANGLVLKVTSYGAIITELHVPDRGGPPGLAQIDAEGLTDVMRQRQTVASPPFPPHDEFARSPVDVAQPQARDLSGAKPEPRQQGQNRQVTSSHHRVPVAGRAGEGRARATWLRLGGCSRGRGRPF